MASSPPLDTDVAIETPEHIVFRHRLAGPARRFFAYLIDVLVILLVLFVVIFVVAIASVGSNVFTGEEGALGVGTGAFLVIAFAAEWLYFLVFEALYGRTLGKRALGIRVVTTAGRPIGWRASALRNILRAADALPLPTSLGPGTMVLALLSPAGAISMALTGRFQRLGDLVAGTMVVVTERSEAHGAVILWPPAQPQELATMPDTVTLDADERLAIELFLRRRMTLGRPRELELATMIAAPLANRFGFRAGDPSRTLALLYDRAVNAGRGEAPASSVRPDLAVTRTAKGAAPREKREQQPWR
jgi:uncharacterized RDD family membrane protein YckC